MAADESKKKKVDEAAKETGEAAVTEPAKAAGAKPAAKAGKPSAKAAKPAAKAAAKAEKAAEKAAKPAAKAAEKAGKAATKAGKPAETAAKAEKPGKAKAAAPASKRAAKPKAESAAEGGAEKPSRVKAAKPAAAKAAKPAARARATKAAETAAEAPVKAERPPRVKVERPAHEPRHGQPGVATVVDGRGAEVGTRELAPERFAVPADVHSLHLVVRAEQAARRRGTASTKTRGEISGSTAKLYRQKGTGRARAGSVKSPLRTGGGTVFGPKPRSYAIKVNRKVARKALAMALSDRAAHGDVFVASGLDLEAPSTRRLNEVLTAIDCAAPVLVVTHDEPTVSKSVRNLFYAETAEATALSTEQVLRARSLVLTEKAFDALNRG